MINKSIDLDSIKSKYDSRFEEIYTKLSSISSIEPLTDSYDISLEPNSIKLGSEILPPDTIITSPTNNSLLIPKIDYNLYSVNILPNKNPLVSIILVARNESEWLLKTVESILNKKTNIGYEIIVYDDFSLDKCYEDISVHQFFRSNNEAVGPSRARNIGAIHSKGEILVFGDSHLKFNDYWLDILIKPILDYQCEAVNPIISDITIPTTKGFGWDFDLNSYQYKWSTPTQIFRLVPGMAGGCFAIVKDVFNKVGMFDKAFTKWGMEDSELSLRLSLCGYRIGIEPLVDVGHFFKEKNEYGVDWKSYNYNFLRMAYVNMNPEDIEYVYSLIKGEESEKLKIFNQVIDTSKYRKRFCESLRKIDFSEYKRVYGRKMG